MFDPPYTLISSSTPKGCSISEIKAVFSPFGKLYGDGINISPTKKDTRFYIHFATVGGAIKAYKALNSTICSALDGTSMLNLYYSRDTRLKLTAMGLLDEAASKITMPKRMPAGLIKKKSSSLQVPNITPAVNKIVSLIRKSNDSTRSNCSVKPVCFTDSKLSEVSATTIACTQPQNNNYSSKKLSEFKADRAMKELQKQVISNKQNNMSQITLPDERAALDTQTQSIIPTSVHSASSSSSESTSSTDLSSSDTSSDELIADTERTVIITDHLYSKTNDPVPPETNTIAELKNTFKNLLASCSGCPLPPPPPVLIQDTHTLLMQDNASSLDNSLQKVNKSTIDQNGSFLDKSSSVKSKNTVNETLNKANTFEKSSTIRVTPSSSINSLKNYSIQQKKLETPEEIIEESLKKKPSVSKLSVIPSSTIVLAPVSIRSTPLLETVKQNLKEKSRMDSIHQSSSSDFTGTSLSPIETTTLIVDKTVPVECDTTSGRKRARVNLASTKLLRPGSQRTHLFSNDKRKKDSILSLLQEEHTNNDTLKEEGFIRDTLQVVPVTSIELHNAIMQTQEVLSVDSGLFYLDSSPPQYKITLSSVPDCLTFPIANHCSPALLVPLPPLLNSCKHLFLRHN